MLVIFLLLLTWGKLATAVVPQPTPVRALGQQKGCGSGQFECTEGGHEHPCIPELWLCNEIDDCLDGADEDPQLCSNYHELRQCTEEEFECPSNKQCISKNWLCDGENDCKDNADEKDCPLKTCKPGEFECDNKHCVLLVFLCNEHDDCGDGSDERHCECFSSKAFNCSNNMGCPPSDRVCDGKSDCKDNSDEGGRCSDEVCGLNCGSNGKCFKTPNGPRCDCQQGFRENRGVCKDIDECADMFTCDHTCSNTQGNYTCSCKSGYYLHGKETCRAAGQASAMLLYTFKTSVQGIYLDTKTQFSVHSGDVMTVAVAYDPVDSKVYWSDHMGNIYRKSLARNDLELFINRGVGIVYSLAIDWEMRNLYISDNKSNSIIVCNIRRDSCATLDAQPSRPTYLQVDIAQRQLFWVEAEKKRIKKSNLDGSGARVLVDGNLEWPNALAFDSASRRLYWMDAAHNAVGCVDVDRNELREVPGFQVNHPSSAAVWEDFIYWNDWEDKCLYQALKKDGSNKTHLLRHEGNGIVLYHEQMNKDVSGHQSLNCQCSHICLPSASSYSCSCPHEMILSSNRKDCLDRTDLPYFILGAGSSLYSMVIRKYQQPVVKKFEVRETLRFVSDLDYDPLEDALFIADRGRGEIIRVDLATRRTEIIVKNILRVTGVSVDWQRRNVYWVDSQKGSLEVATTRGQYRKQLALGTTSCSGLSIAVHPDKGRVLLGCDGKILSCTRSGQPCIRLPAGRVVSPIGITIDQRRQEELVYWTDSSQETVNMMDLDGFSREKVKSSSYGGIIRSDGNTYVTPVGDYSFITHYRNLTSGKADGTLVLSVLENLKSMPRHKNHWAITEIGWKPSQMLTSLYQKFCVEMTPQCQQLCLEHDIGKVCACSSSEDLADDGFSCKAKTCKSDEFLCADGTCIPLTFACNEAQDCADGSDEIPTSCPKCDESSFRCRSGKCIKAEQKCDGSYNCHDHSDEMGCAKPSCLKGFLPCANGDCFLNMSRCDGTNHCADGSDELDCPPCQDDEFKCDNGIGKCQPISLLCDGTPDCLDSSDEANCDVNCAEGEFKCADQSICLPANKVCDSELDCKNGDDELPQMCAKGPECDATVSVCKVSCTEDQFQCNRTKNCIDRNQLCDGTSNCDDASDEYFCQVIQSPNSQDVSSCDRGDFHCGSGECIADSKVCDGVQHCSNGADESRSCEESCKVNKGGCAHECHSGADSRRCFCRRGFKLAEDLASCEDVDECSENDPCEQLCINTPGGHQCSCVEGYLPSKTYFCRPANGRKQRIALLYGNTVSWLGGVPVRIIGPDDLNITHASYDDVDDAIIALDVRGVLGKVNSSDLKWTPIMNGLSDVTALDVDASDRNAYVAQANRGRRINYASLKVCSMRTSICFTIYENTEILISSVAVAKAQRLLFFCTNGLDSTASTIFQSKLDGSGRIEIARPKLRGCSAIALDEPKGIIYWVDPELQQLNSAAFSGHRTSVFKSLRVPVTNLLVFGPSVQWLLPNSTLQYCQKHSSRYCHQVQLNIPATAITTSKAVTTHESRLCQEEKCKNLCISSSSAASCLCDNISANECSVTRTLLMFENSSCNPDFCMPGGTCVEVEGGGVTCSCFKGYEGDTCDIVQAEPHGHKYVAPLVAVFVLLVLGIAGATAYYRYKKPLFLFKMTPRWASRTKTQVRFSNPAYGAPEEEIDATLRRGHAAIHDCESKGGVSRSTLVTVQIDREDVPPLK
ncbi:low-density lipoprotein receptor-related protein 1B [Hyalella azteca]|uniref:Low-density lipoprotein receptor-related protein 1B n=1 Tax=Hyalella azteca TaxID=294128 RepID=A0A8B7NY35_HYAAZ|nr:low-density lipoprotein receptor-related protein 1B [Hyalella azteca]